MTLASGKSRWNDKDTLHVKVCTKIVKVWFYHRKILCHIKFKEIQKNVYIHTFSKKRTKVDYQCYKLCKVLLVALWSIYSKIKQTKMSPYKSLLIYPKQISSQAKICHLHFFFAGLPCLKKLSHSPEGWTLWNPKYAQVYLDGSEGPSASKIGHSF